MLTNLLQRLTELERRLANLLIIGTISDTNYEDAVVKVTSGQLETGWLHWLTSRAAHDVDYWAPEINEQVLVLCPGGDPELGLVLPAIYQQQFACPDTDPNIRRVRFADGADLSYDRAAHVLNIILPEGASMALIAKQGIMITGDTKITGKLSVTDDIHSAKNITDQTRSMAADRDIYNTHDHPHGDPITGKVNQKQ